MTKRIISIIMVMVMSVTAGITVRASSQEMLPRVGFIRELTDRPASEPVRRDEFAAVAASLGGMGVCEPTETAFGDVSVDNPYSGAVRVLSEAKIMNGVGDTYFEPEKNITFIQALTVYIKLLGYEQWANAQGGYPNGYMLVSTKLKLYNAINAKPEDILNFEMLWKLTEALLETPVADFKYTKENGELTEILYLSKNSPLFCEKNLGINIYEADVDCIDMKSYSIGVTITDSRYGAPLSVGDTAWFKSVGDIDIIKFEKAPVKIWVKDNETLVNIDTAANVSIVYGTVYSVNNDISETAKYQISKIDEIMLWDDDTKYETAGNFSFVYNEKAFSGSIAIAGRYVRMVVRDREILAMETWDFNDGGIVKEANFKTIVYSKGDTELHIKNLQEYEKVTLILDGEKRDVKDLRQDTIIDYFVSDDKTSLVILGSERNAFGILESVSSQDMEIDGLAYLMSDNLYCSKNGEEYRAGLDSELFGSEVKVYFDGYSKVRYIKTTAETKTNEFIGYLLGVKSASGLDKTREIYAVNLDDTEFSKKVYKVSDNLDETDVSYAALGSSYDLKNSNSIFKFNLNGREEIIKVSKLSPYFGYDVVDGLVSYSHSGQFPERGNPMYFEIGTEKKRLYFDTNERIVAIYDNNGETAFGLTNYRELAARRPSSAMVFSFFGEYLSDDFKLILLSGDMSTLSGDLSSYGFVSSLRTGIDDEGEKITLAEISGKKYVVNPDDVQGLKENMMVYYSVVMDGYADFDIDIKDSVLLDGDFYSWEGKTGTNGNILLERGTVEKIGSKRIYFRTKDNNGDEIIEAYFFNTNGSAYSIYDIKTGKFSEGSVKDPLQGKDVIYIVTSNGMVSNVFYTE